MERKAQAEAWKQQPVEPSAIVDATPREPEEKGEEKKRSGFLIGFLERLGLSAPKATSQGIGVGARVGAAGQGLGVGGGLGVPQAGFFATLLATKAGIVALVLSALSIAAGLGTVGRGAFINRSKGGAIDRLMSKLPLRPGAPEAGAAAAPGASSLDYMAQAAAKDELLQGEAAPGAQETAAEPAFDPAFFPKPPTHDAPPAGEPNKTSASLKTFNKVQSFAGQSSGGSGAVGRGVAGSTFQAEGLKQVHALTGMRQDRKMAAAGGRRALVGSRGMRTSDALKRALKDGQSAMRGKNPTMARAGATFDGAAATSQSAPAGVPQGSFGGEAPSSKAPPNRVLDQRDVPAPPQAGETKDSTPYKGLMYAAIGALLLAFVLQMMAGQKKEAAKGMVGLEKAGALATAATMHWLAAASAAAAAGIGVMLMTQYDQKMQGMMFTGAGGLLAFFNVKAALDASKDSKAAEAAQKEALDKAATPADDAVKQLSADPSGKQAAAAEKAAVPKTPANHDSSHVGEGLLPK